MNSILHIIESILSQEELPDFYEENLPQIMEACFFIVGQDYPQFAKVPEEITVGRRWLFARIPSLRWSSLVFRLLAFPPSWASNKCDFDCNLQHLKH